jgi:hypothetical protein
MLLGEGGGCRALNKTESAGDKTESNGKEKKTCGACAVLRGSHEDTCC